MMKMMNRRMVMTVAVVCMVWLTAGAQRAVINDVWIDHNVNFNGQKGMKIYTRFTIDKTSTFDIQVLHYFEYLDGRPVVGSTPGYTTGTNPPQVTSILKGPVIPSLPKTEFTWWHFFPYSALNLGGGDYNIRLKSCLWSTTSQQWLYTRSIYATFDYHGGGQPAQQSPAPYKPKVIGEIPDPPRNAPAPYKPLVIGEGPVNAAPIDGGGYNGGNGGGNSNSHRSGSTFQKDCRFCYGTGRCHTCNGKGWYTTVGSSKPINCPNCVNGTCSHCNGSGKQ